MLPRNRLLRIRRHLSPFRSPNEGSVPLEVRFGTIMLLAFTLSPVMGRVDEASLRARIIYLGDASLVANRLILNWIGVEPKFTLTIVPCDLEFMTFSEAKKFTQLYLPRNYDSLNTSYDIVVLHNISPKVVPSRVLDFFKKGVFEEGIGLGLITFMFWGGGQGTNDIETWIGSSFYDTFPADVDVSMDYPSARGRTYWRVVRKQPILSMPGIEKQPMRSIGKHGGDIWPRPGSKVRAVWRGSGTPVMVTGTYGSGATLQLAKGWHTTPLSVFINYEYMPDLIYNQLYLLTKAEPPQDLELVHMVRGMFLQVDLRTSVMLATMDFVDKLGGRLDLVEREIATVESTVEEGERVYLRGHCLDASARLEQALPQIDSLDELLVRVKKKTMMWIFILEWLVVSSTAMLSGVFIWWIMVQRKLYRPVQNTSLSELGRK